MVRMFRFKTSPNNLEADLNRFLAKQRIQDEDIINIQVIPIVKALGTPLVAIFEVIIFARDASLDRNTLLRSRYSV